MESSTRFHALYQCIIIWIWGQAPAASAWPTQSAGPPSAPWRQVWTKVVEGQWWGNSGQILPQDIIFNQIRQPLRPNQCAQCWSKLQSKATSMNFPVLKSTRTVRRSQEDLNSLVWKWNETISKSSTTSPPGVFRLLLLHHSHQR